jgi:hypothetical protein
MTHPTITTQGALRAAFWETYSDSIARHYRRGKRQNDYPADVRMAWVDYVDACQRNGAISEKLAQRATL